MDDQQALLALLEEYQAACPVVDKLRTERAKTETTLFANIRSLVSEHRKKNRALDKRIKNASSPVKKLWKDVPKFQAALKNRSAPVPATSSPRTRLRKTTSGHGLRSSSKRSDEAHSRVKRSNVPQQKHSYNSKDEIQTEILWEAYDTLGKHVNIVLSKKGHWIKLDCFECHKNTLPSGKLISGVKGYISHLKAEHNREPGIKELPEDWVIRTCGRKLLAKKAWGILDGTERQNNSNIPAVKSPKEAKGNNVPHHYMDEFCPCTLCGHECRNERCRKTKVCFKCGPHDQRFCGSHKIKATCFYVAAGAECPDDDLCTRAHDDIEKRELMLNEHECKH